MPFPFPIVEDEAELCFLIWKGISARHGADLEQTAPGLLETRRPRRSQRRGLGRLESVELVASTSSCLDDRDGECLATLVDLSVAVVVHTVSANLGLSEGQQHR